MVSIKNLVYVLAVAFGISFLDGMFSLMLPNWVTIFLGVVDAICIVWLIMLVSGKGK